MNDTHTTEEVLKAHDGHRAKNLDAIAETLREYAHTKPQRVNEELLGMAEQLGIIADEIRPLYDVHWLYRGETRCGWNNKAGTVSNEKSMVTCKRCLMQDWFYELDCEFIKRAGKNWHHLANDWEQIEAWYDEEERRPVEQIVADWLAQNPIEETS